MKLMSTIKYLQMVSMLKLYTTNNAFFFFLSNLVLAYKKFSYFILRHWLNLLIS